MGGGGGALGEAVGELLDVLRDADVAVLHVLLRVVVVGLGEVLAVHRVRQLLPPLPAERIADEVAAVLEEVVGEGEPELVEDEGAVVRAVARVEQRVAHVDVVRDERRHPDPRGVEKNQ